MNFNSIIIVLIWIEILISAIILFIVEYSNNIHYEIYIIYIIILASIESTIFITILVLFFKSYSTVNINFFIKLIFTVE